MSNINQEASTSAKTEATSTEKCEKNPSNSNSANKDTVANEEMIKKAKRALLADADRFKNGTASVDSKRRPPTSIVNTGFLSRLLNQPNRGRIVKPKKTNSTKNKVKK